MRWHLLLVILPLFVDAAALADEPASLTHPQDYGRSASPVWSNALVLASETAHPVNVGSTGSGANEAAVPVVFGWGTRVLVTARRHSGLTTTATAITCCWSLSSSVTIGSQAESSLVSAQVVDTSQTYTNPSGGACLAMPASGAMEMIPDYTALYASFRPGYRAGICSGVQAPQVDVQPHRPLCSADGDCTDAGVSGGTCLLTKSQDNANLRRGSGGAFLMCAAHRAAKLWISILR